VQGSSPAEYPSFPTGILVRDKRRYWPGGVWGDPSKASADKGAKLEDLVVAKVVELVKMLEEGRYA
jgi:creatinine amidohydrolase